MTTTFKIQNLKCGGCANTIVKRLSELKGIENVIVDNEANSVTFEHENASLQTEASKLLSKLGYPVVGDKNTLSKKAKSYVSCAVGRINN